MYDSYHLHILSLPLADLIQNRLGVSLKGSSHKLTTCVLTTSPSVDNEICGDRKSYRVI